MQFFEQVNIISDCNETPDLVTPWPPDPLRYIQAGHRSRTTPNRSCSLRSSAPRSAPAWSTMAPRPAATLCALWVLTPVAIRAPFTPLWLIWKRRAPCPPPVPITESGICGLWTLSRSESAIVWSLPSLESEEMLQGARQGAPHALRYIQAGNKPAQPTPENDFRSFRLWFSNWRIHPHRGWLDDILWWWSGTGNVLSRVLLRSWGMIQSGGSNAPPTFTLSSPQWNSQLLSQSLNSSTLALILKRRKMMSSSGYQSADFTSVCITMFSALVCLTIKVACLN